ncbi:hypothetical protein EXN66_Car014499 [Channa argus]|uniref:Uncharacterized protein n=1 Tax=Channa argus TaxID=215402 RepID=A0A6G1Q8G6_CHAAH|nr:hypothetical protein EXN66_Car014499 [Channa argus]
MLYQFARTTNYYYKEIMSLHTVFLMPNPNKSVLAEKNERVGFIQWLWGKVKDWQTKI